MVVSLGVMFRMGYTSQQVQLMMNAVSEANLSKFCLTEDEAKESVEAYKQDGRYINVDYKFNEGYYVVFGSKAEKDGAKYKILKKAGWESPEEKLKDIVDAGYLKTLLEEGEKSREKGETKTVEEVKNSLKQKYRK